MPGSTPMLDRPIGGDRAWVGGSIDRSQWLFPISADCLAELQAAIDHHRSHPLPIILSQQPDLRPQADRLRGRYRPERHAPAHPIVVTGLGRPLLSRLTATGSPPARPRASAYQE